MTKLRALALTIALTFSLSTGFAACANSCEDEGRTVGVEDAGKGGPNMDCK